MESMVGIKNYIILTEDQQPSVPGEKEEEGVIRGRQTLEHVKSLNLPPITQRDVDDIDYREADHWDEIVTINRRKK